jgi:drug/metabolite transporter (DMT)-like permease
VANTLTVFAIRDVGLAIAFPMWNANSLIGLLWARLLFRELEGAGPRIVLRVIFGSLAIVLAAILLGYSSLHGDTAHAAHAGQGILAALGASLLWGTMYVPYRKAYLSGMNPLSFVTAFTVGELATVLTLALMLGGGAHAMLAELERSRGALFWLFLGGFVWVVGDLFQQYAAKYLGIGRGIPLSNTNQIWGLAWGALVFGELAGADRAHLALVLAGSLAMIAGAALISSAAAAGEERSSRDLALLRECERYGLDYRKTLLNMDGDDAEDSRGRRWWDYAIVALAVAVFVWLGMQAHVPKLPMRFGWMTALMAILVLSLVVGGVSLWRRTDFS